MSQSGTVIDSGHPGTFQVLSSCHYEIQLVSLFSAVARGGAGGGRAPPVFFLKSKNRPV